MVKIRYTELPAGLHVAAKSSRGDTIVYLLPGLTPAERRVALNRVRSSGLMGHGPRPSAASLLIADGVDRLRTVAANGAAAMRGHPVLLIPSLLVMTGTLFALVSLATMTVPQPAGGAASPNTLRSNHVTGGQRPSKSDGGANTGQHAGHRAGAPDRRRELRAEALTSGGDCVTYFLFGVCGPQ